MMKYLRMIFSCGLMLVFSVGYGQDKGKPLDKHAEINGVKAELKPSFGLNRKTISKGKDSLNMEQAQPLDLYERNPYNHLPLPVVPDRANGQTCYDLKGAELSEVFGPILPQLPKDWKPDDIELTTAGSCVNVVESGSMTYLNYCFRVYQACGDPIGSLSTIIILDSLDKQIGASPETGVGYFQLAPSEDGQYLGFTTGDALTNCDRSMSTDYSFQILEKASNLIVYRLNPKGWLHRPFYNNGKFIIADKITNQEKSGYLYVYRIIDPVAGIEYSKEFTKEEKILFKEFKTDGIEIYQSDSKLKYNMVSFKDDFNMKRLSR